MSPIKGLSEVRRLPRAGKIRIGIKEVNKAGVEYPRGVDYFVCPDEVKEVYGEQPKALKILFPTENEEQFFSQFYKLYQASGLKCKGDGETATRLNKEGGMEPYECKGRKCPDYESAKCKHIGILQFLLPDVPGIGVWQISTASWNSIVNINSAIEYVRGLCGRIQLIPLTLKVEEQTVQPNGKKKIVHVLSIDTKIRLSDLQKAAEISPQRIALPAPDESEETLLIAPPVDEEEKEEPKTAGMKTTKSQLARIHILKKRAVEIGAINEEDYYKVLKEDYSVDHSNEITSDEAEELIERLEVLIEKNEPPEELESIEVGSLTD